MQLIIGIIIIMFRERNKFFICNKPFHFTLFTKQFKIQMQCVQCNLQQSGGAARHEVRWQLRCIQKRKKTSDTTDLPAERSERRYL